MNANLQLWNPPERKEIDKANQYQAAVEQQNDIAITELIAEKRDDIMRQQISVAGKFMARISTHLDDISDEKMSRIEQRKTMRSLAETLKTVADVQSKAAVFTAVPKQREREDQNGRISLFVNCAPVGIARQAAIDVASI